MKKRCSLTLPPSWVPDRQSPKTCVEVGEHATGIAVNVGCHCGHPGKACFA